MVLRCEGPEATWIGRLGVALAKFGTVETGGTDADEKPVLVWESGFGVGGGGGEGGRWWSGASGSEGDGAHCAAWGVRPGWHFGLLW